MTDGEPIATRTDGGWKVEILDEGRSISRLWIADRRMRIGAAVLCVGGIAGVGTDSEFRNRGLARRVLDRSLALMADEGYDASFLYGIQDFYHRLGFATCMPEWGLSVDTRDAERAESRLKVRPLRPADLSQVRALYNRGNAGRTASVVRGRGWSGFPMGSGFFVPGATQVVCEPGAPGRILGYVLYDDVADRCRAAEVGGRGAQVWGAILRFLARRAVALRRERITASLPLDHPFAIYCRSFGCRDETGYPRNAGPMGRLIDLERFLTALAPELAGCWPAGAQDRITLRTDIGAADLRRRRGGRVDVQQRGTRAGAGLEFADQGTLFQLAMGYRTVDDAVAAGQLRGSPRALQLATALFPLRSAHMWWPDRF